MNDKRDETRAHTIYLLRHSDSRQDEIKRYTGQADLPLISSAPFLSGFPGNHLLQFCFAMCYVVTYITCY
jgi:hypothetical protein